MKYIMNTLAVIGLLLAGALLATFFYSEATNPTLVNCQKMHDGTIICPPSYPDSGNDQSD